MATMKKISSKKSKPPIRAIGQRSIPSTLLFRPSPKGLTGEKKGSNPIPNPNSNSNVLSERSNNGGSIVSLTSFLNRKLNPTTPTATAAAVLPVEKVNEEHHSFEKPRERKPCVVEESVFKLFNTNSEEKVRKRSLDECLTDLSSATPSRSQFDVRKDSQKHVLVLGDDPKPKKRAYRRVSNDDEIPKPLYNHYENGTGWWDSEREGIDNDAVGHKEVWEGVGSTTLGGLDWH